MGMAVAAVNRVRRHEQHPLQCGGRWGCDQQWRGILRRTRSASGRCEEGSQRVERTVKRWRHHSTLGCKAGGWPREWWWQHRPRAAGVEMGLHVAKGCLDVVMV